MGTKSQHSAKILALLVVLCGMRGGEGGGEGRGGGGEGGYKYAVVDETMIQVLLSQTQAEFSPLEIIIVGIFGYHQQDCTSRIVPAPDVIMVVYVYPLNAVWSQEEEACASGRDQTRQRARQERRVQDEYRIRCTF